MRSFLLAILLLLSVSICEGQYTFQTQMNTYQDLQNPTSLNQGAVWAANTYQVYFNFDFDILGQPHSALNVHSHGGISFAGLGMKELFVFHTPFGGYLLQDRGTTTSMSPIGYEITGTPGQQILKIEWKNAGFVQWYNTSDTADYVDFQIWIYEAGGRIDIRFGDSSTDPGTYGYPDAISDPDPGSSVKWWFDDCSNVLSVTGASNLPSYSFLNICSPNYSFIDGTPDQGITYIINPTTVDVEPAMLQDIQVAPSLASSAFRLSGLDASQTYQSAALIETSGKMVKDLLPSLEGQSEVQVDVSGMPAGLYFLRLEDANGQSVTRKVIKVGE